MTRSFESILNGGMYDLTKAKGPATSVEGLVFFGAAKTFSDSANSPEFYASESQRLFGEAKQADLMVNNTLESLNSNFILVAALKKKMSLEGLDPVKFVTEAVDLKAMFKKAWEGIKIFFQKMGTAIINFIKSITNFVRGKVYQLRARVYEDALKNGFAENYNKFAGTTKITAIPVKGARTTKFGVATSYISRIIDAEEKIAPQMAGALEKMMRTVLDGKNVGDGSVGAVTDEYVKAFKEAVATLPGVKAFTEDADFKIAMPSQKIVNFMIYGSSSVEAKEIPISEFAQVADFAFLSKQSIKDVEKMVNSAKKSANNIKKMYNWVVKMQAGASQADQGRGAFKTIMSMILAKSRNMRAFSTYSNGLLIAWYGTFLKDNSYLYQAMTAIQKAAKPSKKPTESPSAAK